MRRTAVAAAVAVGLTMALAAGTSPAQDLVVAPRIEVGNRAEADGSSSTLRVSTEDGRMVVLRVDGNGDLVLRWGAMIDFNGITLPKAGKQAGYLMVLVDGKPYLVPLQELPVAAEEDGARKEP